MNSLSTYIVYLDDAEYAQRELSGLLSQPHTKRWILVACAPRMTRRIGKWLSHSARENWRDKWCDKLFSQFTPLIHRTDHVFCEVANGPLQDYTAMLLKELGQAEVIDARRPKFGIEMQPVVQPAPQKPVTSSLPNLPLTGARPVLG